MPVRRDARRVISVPLLLNTMVFAMRAGCRCAHRRVDRMPRVEPKGVRTEEEDDDRGLMAALKDALRAEPGGPI